MYKIDILPDAMAQFIEIDLDTEDDKSVEADYELIHRLLQTMPLSVGEWRASSVHRMICRGRILCEYEVIEDDKRVLVHSFSLLPSP